MGTKHTHMHTRTHALTLTLTHTHSLILFRYTQRLTFEQVEFKMELHVGLIHRNKEQPLNHLLAN